MKFVTGDIDWRLPAVIGAVSVSAALFGATEWLQYDRDAIAGGQVWRLLSGHFVHLGWRHLWLNLAGLLLVWLLVGGGFDCLEWALIVIFCALGISIGFWFLDPGLQWYVGLSGVLHGLLLAGLLQGLFRGSAEAIVLTLAVVAKLAYEQLLGPLPGSEQVAGGPVLVNAHLYGFIAGGLAGLVIRRKVRKTAIKS